jgi:hypothetical protein
MRIGDVCGDNLAREGEANPSEAISCRKTIEFYVFDFSVGFDFILHRFMRQMGFPQSPSVPLVTRGHRAPISMLG